MMYFFLEKHKNNSDNFVPISFDIIQAKNLDQIKKSLISAMRDKAKEIKYYYDDPYHVFDFIDLNDINYVFRFGKVSKEEVKKTLEEFDDVKVITL